jgi:hypothetical protein
MVKLRMSYYDAVMAFGLFLLASAGLLAYSLSNDGWSWMSVAAAFSTVGFGVLTLGSFIFLRKNLSKERDENCRRMILTAMDERELTPHQIINQMKETFGKEGQFYISTFYPCLIQLEREGSITSRWAWPTPLPFPRRRLYKISAT